jgi:S1-C subfamily serine protease
MGFTPVPGVLAAGSTWAHAQARRSGGIGSQGLSEATAYPEGINRLGGQRGGVRSILRGAARAYRNGPDTWGRRRTVGSGRSRGKTGFAIPANTVRYVVSQILTYGHVRRPWIGIVVTRPPAANGLGLFVVAVEPNSPAERAGVRPGDFLVAIAGRPVSGVRDVVRVLEHSAVGQTVAVTLERGGQRRTVAVKLGERRTTAAVL